MARSRQQSRPGRGAVPCWFWLKFHHQTVRPHSPSLHPSPTPTPVTPTVTLTWHASKNKVHKLHQRYLLRRTEVESMYLTLYLLACQVTLCLCDVLRALIQLPCVLILHQRSGPRSVSYRSTNRVHTLKAVTCILRPQNKGGNWASGPYQNLHTTNRVHTLKAGPVSYVHKTKASTASGPYQNLHTSYTSCPLPSDELASAK